MKKALRQEIPLLLPFASPKHAELMRATLEYEDTSDAAKALGVSPGVLRSVISRARKRRAESTVNPELHVDSAPENYILSGVSTLRKTSGGQQQWVKTKLSPEARQRMLDAFWEAFTKELPQLPAVPARACASDIMSVYPVSDTHLGMLAWHGETGEDADLDIISSLLASSIDILSSGAPGGPCTLELLGDFFHFDGVAPVTTKSGNILDSDSRYAKVWDTALWLMRRLIETLLERHSSLHLVVASGNHDEASARHLATAMHHIYYFDERVTVDTSHSMFHYVKWGDVGIMIHHGDKAKINKLQEVFAGSKTWCETKHRFVHSGHIHQDRAIDKGACLVESFRVIIPPDSYAHGHGYGVTGRELRRIDYHKRYGRVSTAYVNPDMIHGILKDKGDANGH